jgi:small subunit ribosomal protein S3Ae
MIEAFSDVKTTDGYLLRVFAIAFTKNPRDSQRETAYAQHTKVITIKTKCECRLVRACHSSPLHVVL